MYAHPPAGGGLQLQHFPGPPATPALSLVERLSKAVTDFTCALSSPHSGALSQVWLPEVGEDGNIQLNTQGLPYAINGTGDLLALFRCISCKYKFATDLTKPQLMGAVGRVFTSGEPEMSHNVQQYDKSVFLRVAEAQRCRVSSALFMPLFNTPKRDCVLGVFEVVQTDRDVIFPAIVDWLRCCLKEMGLYTADVDKNAYAVGLRQMPPEYQVSAFESGTAAVALQQQQQQQQAVRTLAAAAAAGLAPQGLGAEARGAMGPPPPPLALAALALQQVAALQQAAQQAHMEVEQPVPAAPAAAAAAAARPLSPARPSRSDPTSNRTLTVSDEDAPAAAAAAPAAQGAGPALQPTADGQPPTEGQGRRTETAARGDTLMGSSGQAPAIAGGALMASKPVTPGAGSGPPREGRDAAEPAPAEGEQQSPAQKRQRREEGARPAAPAAAAAATMAAGGDEEEEEEGEEEVVQPAKLLPPQPRSGSGGQLQSSGATATASREERGLGGPGSNGMPSPMVQPQEGSGRGSNPSGDNPTPSPPPPAYPTQLAASPFVALAAGAAAAGGDEGGHRLERVGTSAHLSELERARQQQQQQVLGKRPSSAPPSGGWGPADSPNLPAFGSGDRSGDGLPSPGGSRPQVGSAEATTLNQPLAAALISMLTAGTAAQSPTAGPQLPIPPLLQHPPPPGAQPSNSPQQVGVGMRGPSPTTAGGPAAPRPPLLPGGALTIVPPRPPTAPGSAAATAVGGAAELARAGSGAFGSAADLGRLGSGGLIPDLSRINSAGVGQKNLTLEDLQPHFGFGLKEAASRLGICPTTLKRTCRRLGISRWPRRQLVRLTKQAAAAVKAGMDEAQQQRPPSTSDGSGSGGGLRPGGGAAAGPGLQLPLRPPGAIGSPAGGGPGVVIANPGLLLALQQAQQGGGGGGGDSRPGVLPLLNPASLHQQLLQLQQQQRPGQPSPLGGPGIRIDPAQLLSLQRQLASTAAPPGVDGNKASGPLPSPGQGPGPGPANGSMPLPFMRGSSGPYSSGPLPPLPPLPDGPRPGSAAPAAQDGMAWAQQQAQQQQQQQQHMGGRMKQEAGVAGPTGGPFPFFGPPPVAPHPPLPAGQRHLPAHEPPASGAHFAGLGGSHWQLPQRGPPPGNPPHNRDGHFAELAAAAAAANMQHQLGGGFGQPPRRSPQQQLHNGFSLSNLPHLGEHLQLAGYSAESLDILAAADFDSVANSPRGVSHLGGLSNLGLSNLGVSNLELPGGAGLEFSVGAPPFAGTTSSQRP